MADKLRYLLAAQSTKLSLSSKNLGVHCPQLFARHLALGLAGQLDPSQGLATHIMNGTPRGQAKKDKHTWNMNFRNKSTCHSYQFRSWQVGIREQPLLTSGL